MIGLRNSDSPPGPVQWYGGKGILAPRIVPLIPDTRVYVEPFGGSASIMFALRPRAVEVYNDLDGNLVNLFRVMQDPRSMRRLRWRLEHTLYSLDEFRKALADAETDAVGKAWAFFVRQNQGFSGVADTEGNWSRALVSGRGMAGNVSRWRNRVSCLSEWGKRLARVQIDNRDALEVIRYWDSPDTCFYLDPPYHHDTRANGKCDVYKGGEMTHDQHVGLVRLLLEVKGAVVLSGYAHESYSPLEAAGWTRVDIVTACHAAGKGRGSGLQGEGNAPSRVETVWRNQRAEATPLFT
jgi:DNA adenine methylase